ncbi:MAG TPA: PKD domain-containing protein, partial [Bauldia sp.]|nr:PKD domain-containing protein [Bauldia sp.]
VRDDTGHEEAFDHAEASVVINASPVAEAGADVVAAPGDEVTLSAAASFDSDGEIASYRWDFSDLAEPMEGVEVTRAFTAPGVYTAQLTVTDDSGASNGVDVDSLRIAINHQPVADAGPRIFTDATTITFDGTRSLDGDGNPLTYAWDFGDGTTGTGAIVTHTYAGGGTYPVVLTVDDGTGLRNASARTALDVAINRAPVAVAGENLEVCTGDIIVLDGSKSSDAEGSVLRYDWDFGDGTGSEIVNPTKSYVKGGTYPVTLTVRDDTGLSNAASTDRIAIRVDQGPVADAGDDILACAGTEVQFDGTGSTDIDGVVNSFTWDFGDGDSGGGETPRHIYERPGDYRAFLTIEGEKAGICSAVSTDEVEVRIIEGPVAVIEAPSAVPITSTVNFDGSASHMAEGRITSYAWDFGDGSSASGPTVAHRYAEPGTYAVSLTLRSDSTSPTCQVVSARHLIRVNATPVAAAGEDKHVAVGEETVFDASASHDVDGGIVAYEWDFGDGTAATGIHVRHRYLEPGSYTAKLLVRDEADLPNSSSADALMVTVNPAPAPAIDGPAVACIGEEVKWKAADRGEAATYRWIFGDGDEAATMAASHAYRNHGRYSLVLVADDGKGQTNSVQQATKVVHVNRPPFAEAGPDRMVCPGDTVVFDAGASRDLDGAISEYRWDFGDGSVAEGTNVKHVYDRPGTYRVSLTAVDDARSSCSAVTDAVTVTVNAPPVANPGGDREVWIGGANDAILLDGSASVDPDGQALTHDWQIGSEGSETGARVRYSLSTAGEIPVTLTVSDTSGLACGTASGTFTIHAKPR